MADPLIRLTLGTLSVTFQGLIFNTDALPRTKDPSQFGEVSYSAYGGISQDGSPLVPRHTWTFSVAALGDSDLADQVAEIEEEFNRLKRANNDPKIEIEDTTAYFFEQSPRTRALATGASEIITSTGRIKYYAKYYAHFSRPVDFQLGWGFTVQLSESEIFSA